MIRTTLTAMPHRVTVLGAKAAILTGLVLAAGTIAVLGSVLTGRLILPGHGFTAARGFPPLSLGDGPVLRAAAGSVLYLALIALLSLGTATAVRDPAPPSASSSACSTSLPIVAAAAEPALAPPPRADQPDDGRAGHPGHHRPAQPAHQPVGRPRRARRLGRGRPPGRRPAAAAAGRLTSQAVNQANSESLHQ